MVGAPRGSIECSPFFPPWASWFWGAEMDPLPPPADPPPAPSLGHEQAAAGAVRESLDGSSLDQEQQGHPWDGHAEGTGRGQVPQDLGQLLHQVLSPGAGMLEDRKGPRNRLGQTGAADAAPHLFPTRFLDEYAKHNVTFWAVTVQNEPRARIPTFPQFPTVSFTAEQQRDFITHDLGPALARSPHRTQLLIMDDQRMYLPQWAETVKSEAHGPARLIPLPPLPVPLNPWVCADD